jgi:hypothetical protein
MAAVSQSATDDVATVKYVPDGFKVVTTPQGPNFRCTICDIAADP